MICKLILLCIPSWSHIAECFGKRQKKVCQTLLAILGEYCLTGGDETLEIWYGILSLVYVYVICAVASEFRDTHGFVPSPNSPDQFSRVILLFLL